MQVTIAKVGLDVHAAQTQVAVLDPASGELLLRRLRVPPLGVLDFLAELGPRACARLAIASRPTGATRCGWRGCSLLVS